MDSQFILYFRDFSKVDGLGVRFNSPEEAIDNARACVENANRNQHAITEWFVMRVSDGVVLAEGGRSMPVASPVFGMIKRFQMATQYLEHVIAHPERWYDHQMAIDSAKELVFADAQDIADYRS